MYRFVTVEGKEECKIDDDCQRSEICNEGSCIEACRLEYCGSNAICEPGYHSAKCVCLAGYTGDARTSCNRCKFESIESEFILNHSFGKNFEKYDIDSIMTFLSVGCHDKDECPLFNACENTKCIDPCAERNPCAATANCKVINHEPKCTCPDGFIGSPLTDCRPRK